MAVIIRKPDTPVLEYHKLFASISLNVYLMYLLVILGILAIISIHERVWTEQRNTLWHWILSV